MRASSLPWLRYLVLSGFASVALYGASCSSESGGTGGHGGENDALADVIYEGAGNDEALELLLAPTPEENPKTFAIFDSPMEGPPVPASPIPTFAWHVEGLPETGAWTPSGAPRSRWATFDGLNPAVKGAREALGPFLDLVGPERAARAHGSSIGGAGYLLVFSTAGDDKLLRVFTTNLTYTPDEAAWGKLKGAGKAIQAWILTGIFENNVLAAGGGPFQGPWIAFVIE